MSFALKDVTKKARNLPSTICLHGVPGVGKTSFAAYAPSPVFLMVDKEIGLEKLIKEGRLPEVDHFARPALHWADVHDAVTALAREKHDHKTLVIDTLNSLETLCHAAVCQDKFDGDWGEQGFASFGKGYELALTYFEELIAKVEWLRIDRGMAIVYIAHTRVRMFKNPEGADYERYVPRLHDKTWERFSAQADMVLFANYKTDVKKDKGKMKATGGQQAFLYPVRTAAYDAKNRHGLTAPIPMGTTGEQAWGNFTKALGAAKRPAAPANETPAVATPEQQQQAAPSPDNEDAPKQEVPS